MLFLIAIATVGVNVLWATGTAGTLLAWLAVAIVVFINAVFLNGNHASHYPRPIRTLVNAALLGLPFIASLGFWAIALRVEQYGWSVTRLWALYVMAVLFAYGIGYAIAVLRSTFSTTGNWLSHFKPHNTLVALLIIASLSAINLGLPSFYKIAINSQMQRLASGQITWQDFDFKHLRFSAGMQGYNAVVAFKANPSVELSEHGHEYIQEILDSENRWDEKLDATSYSQHKSAITLKDDVTAPEGLIDYILEHDYHADDCHEEANRCALLEVTLRRNGEPDWLFMFQGEHNRHWRLYQKIGDAWQQVGQLNPYNKQNRDAFDQVLEGHFDTAEPEWLDMMINGQRIKVRP